MTSRTFPGLSQALQATAHEAASFGLALTHYNSGTRKHSDNGTRVFRTKCQNVDHFHGGHIAHLNTLDEINAFLAGFRAAS